MNVEARTDPSNAQSYYSVAALETHNDSRDQIVHLESDAGIETHQHKPNVPDHYPVQGASKNSCLECKASFALKCDLELHAQKEGHGVLLCSCGVGFTRPDALRRHVVSFRKETPKFPCTFCKRHRGKHGFRRQDHLVQHLSGYHKFDEDEIGKVCPLVSPVWPDYLACPHPGCEFYRGKGFNRLGWNEQKKQGPFQKRSNYSKHLKDVHNVAPFPCPVPGCERVEAKGYMSDNGLKKHLAREHPNALEYLEKLREEICIRRYDCDQCGERIYGLGEFNIHRQLSHKL
ncbi:hypothetical protein F4776DRAFT_518051 [Hypoxylon sp. NC0597]|nr:hypothetical protein F4776DRAFT_518051 [Hypoxylon sp. NC0597]